MRHSEMQALPKYTCTYLHHKYKTQENSLSTQVVFIHSLSEPVGVFCSKADLPVVVRTKARPSFSTIEAHGHFLKSSKKTINSLPDFFLFYQTFLVSLSLSHCRFHFNLFFFLTEPGHHSA